MILIYTASEKGIGGNSISLLDGTIVDDDDCIEYYAKANEVFVIQMIEEEELFNVSIIDSENIVTGGESFRTSQIDKKIVFEMGESSEMSAGGKFFIAGNDEVADCIGPEKILISDCDGFNNKTNPDHAIQESSSSKQKIDLLGLVSNFPIQTENFSIKIQEKIKNNIRLNNSEKIQVIQRVVDDIQKSYGVNPTSFVIQAVATKLLYLYPILCQIDDEGNVIGNGQFTIIRQIKDRLYYLNNTKQPKIKKIQPLLQSSIKRVATHTGRSLKKKMSGCPNFNPTTKLTNEEVNQKKAWLQKEFKLSVKQRNSDKILYLLNETYPAERNFLVQIPTPKLDMMEKEWPLLFESKYMMLHFQKLCELNFTNKNIQNRMEKIHNLLMDGTKATSDNDLCKSTLDELFKYFKIKASEDKKTDFYSLVEVKLFLFSQSSEKIVIK